MSTPQRAESEHVLDDEITPYEPNSIAPGDLRNGWRVIDALGVWREVASESNARGKAAAFDRVCPARECPHRVERWTGSEWVPADA